tara:strand:+ start:358 stop:513 length:156 start_codon:yes stop_codon:yes gene_type:complete
VYPLFCVLEMILPDFIGEFSSPVNTKAFEFFDMLLEMASEDSILNVDTIIL